MLAIIIVQSKLWPTEWCLSNPRKCLLALIVSNIKRLWTFCFALLLRHDLKISCTPGWLWVCYVATDNSGHPRLQPLPPKCETAHTATVPRLWRPELCLPHILYQLSNIPGTLGAFLSVIIVCLGRRPQNTNMFHTQMESLGEPSSFPQSPCNLIPLPSSHSQATWKFLFGSL